MFARSIASAVAAGVLYSAAGPACAQADIKLGTLTAFNGAQRIAVPAGAELGRRNVFIYCQPFRVEVAKAALMDGVQ